MKILVGILTVSDRCAAGARADASGPALKRLADEQGWEVVEYSVVPDETALIEEVLLDWCDRRGLDVILTTGGTGLGPRDVTPEATRRVLERELPGLPERMRLRHAQSSPRACLSRAVAGSRGRSLILNLPGSPRGARESLCAVLEVLPHAAQMLAGGGHEEERHDHARRGAESHT